MSLSTTASVADAVLQEMEHHTFTLGPVYSRTYDATQKLSDMGVLHVDVIGAGHQLEDVSRGDVARNPVIQIVVRKRLDNENREDDSSELDRLCLFVEELEDYFASRDMDAFEAAWLACQTYGMDTEHYRVHRQFTAVISITFRVFSELSA